MAGRPSSSLLWTLVVLQQLLFLQGQGKPSLMQGSQFYFLPQALILRGSVSYSSDSTNVAVVVSGLAQSQYCSGAKHCHFAFCCIHLSFCGLAGVSGVSSTTRRAGLNATAPSPAASESALQTRAALLRFQDTLFNVTGGLDWYEGMPCSPRGPTWDYVKCSQAGQVTGLELSLLGLTGVCTCSLAFELLCNASEA